MADYPSHASPTLSPQPLRHQQPALTQYSLNSTDPSSSPLSATRELHGLPVSTPALEDGAVTPALPASFLSPAFTPPETPGTQTPTRLPTSAPSRTVQDRRDSIARSKPPKLLSRLPNVECIVRARIPTTTGAEMFLHLYQNDADNKEHLAIVFGNTIRSRSLDRVREGETEMDRMIRGAYVGRLRPGRVSSRYESDDTETAEVNSKGIEKIGSRSVDGLASAKDAGDQLVAEALADPGAAVSSQSQAPLVRIHSECYTGETAWSARCDCGEQLDEAARLMSMPEEPVNGPHRGESPGGVIVYLRQEGRGIGLGEKLKAYNLQDLGSDTVEANLLLRHPADARSYGLATAILVDLGLGNDSDDGGIRLLTNNPDKVMAVEGPNKEITVKERVPMIPLAWRTGGKKGIRSTEIEGYLQAKIGKMGHMIG